ncbi:MAG: efflux RND transporter permease subunit, partial [Candidatus Aminicenantes bacterium]|nr:efflux RND transporter permease subunit [Candidatus Aminicenantes bacterium]
IFGVLPLLLAKGPGAEIQRPLATVVVGGLFTSTLVTLIVLPLLYQTLKKHSPSA